MDCLRNQLTLRSGPSGHLSVKVDTDDLGGLQLPWDTSHDIHGVGTSDTVPRPPALGVCESVPIIIKPGAA
jgi:hypothetical protein